MALTDDITKVVENVDKLTKDGVPITLKHELDTETVSYFALMAFFVVVAAVMLVGVKDVVVAKIVR